MAHRSSLLRRKAPGSSIDNAPLAQIETWLDRLIDASCLDDIFGSQDGAR